MTSARFMLPLLITAASIGAACSTGDAKAKDNPTATPSAVAVAPAAAVEQPIARFIRATGSLTAEEQADVAAETVGRVIAAHIERGTAVAENAELIRLSSTETDAQLKEAEANAAQIEARLGLAGGDTFDVNRVPEVQNAKATYDLAQNEFKRIKSLLDQRVVSQSEYEQRQTQMEATRQQYEAAKNGASQQYQSLLAARARVALARKALADTVVRAPFAGSIAERLVSVGDYVTRGTKVAVVVRTNPLRVKLTVPEQFISTVGVGQPVNFEVDAYPGKQFVGKVQFVSPSLQADQRALTIEAVVPNPKGELKPGLFATARIEQRDRSTGVLIPTPAVQTAAGTSRVFVVHGDKVEERIVTIGQVVGDRTEISSGLKTGEQVATRNLGQLIDGTKVQE
ncbi:MAG TPA: efflux RND transporter periplasmic adaptor subunit [Vicinamibacterales bacterium]|jgi:RND family efflux transporter MFP subunit